MKIPDCVLKKIEKSPVDNQYFYHANEAWKRLTNIYEGRIDYYHDDFAILVNTLERYYKGFLQSKMDIDNSFVVAEDLMEHSHDLVGLVREIEHFTSLSVPLNRQEQIDRRIFLCDLRREYTNARYVSDPSLDDFKKVYKFVENQKEIIFNYLLPKKEKALETSNKEIAEDIDNFYYR